MRTLPLIALMLAPAPLAAQGPWGTVKTWNGTITIEATETVPQEDGLYHKMTYQATGSFSITDDMMPDGYHMQWPMVNPEHPPADREAAYKRWQVHVVGGTEARYVDDRGTKFTVTCQGEKSEAMLVGLTVNPSNDEFVLQFAAPRVSLTCTGGEGGAAESFLRQENFSLTGQRGTPGTKTGSQTFTVDPMTIKVTYSLSPAR
jgi:hypothetical protein